jgi:hypothetical protein
MSTQLSAEIWTGENGFWPDQPVTGEGIQGSVIAGRNVIFESGGTMRAVRPPRLIGEHSYVPVTLGYTAAMTAGSDVVTAAGGSLNDDCVAFQHVSINRKLYVIKRVLSQTQMLVSPRPDTTEAGATITLVPNYFVINNSRASLLAGNAIQDFGDVIFAVGRGALRINGAAVSPSSLVATSNPKLGYPLSSTTYEVRPVGFTKIASLTGITVTAIAGGTKQMPQQSFSFRFSRTRKGFPGYGNASDAVYIAAGSVVANGKFTVDLTSYTASEGENQLRVWVTKALTGNGERGPWFELGDYDIGASHTVEWRDGELGSVYEEDKHLPPEKSLFAFTFNGLLGFASCYGYPDASNIPTTPGKVVQVANANNPEGFDPRNSVLPSTAGDDILGVHVGDYGIFILSPNRLYIGGVTGGAEPPLSIEPKASGGFCHRYNGALADKRFVLFAEGTLMSYVDNLQVSQDDSISLLAKRVETLLKTFDPSRTFIVYDTARHHLLVLASNYRQVSGFWQTIALSFDLQLGTINTPVYLSQDAADFTVTGVATFENRAEFMTQDGKCWRWDDGAGTQSFHTVTEFSNWRTALQMTTMRRVAVTGGLDGSFSVLRDLDYAAANSDTPPATTYALGNVSNTRKKFPTIGTNVKGKYLALRFDGTAQGGGILVDNVETMVEKRMGIKT